MVRNYIMNFSEMLAKLLLLMFKLKLGAAKGSPSQNILEVLALRKRQNFASQA
jgi:hypothetical protein